MSRSVDQKIVELDFENKQFEKNVSMSINTIDKLKKALQMENADTGFLELENAVQRMTFQPMLDGINKLTDSMSTFGKFSTGIIKNLSDDVYAFGKNLWNNTIGQIKSGGSSRALKIANAQFKLEGLGMAWDKANKDISQAVDGTAYGFDAAANAAAQLAGAGVKLGEAYGGMAHSLRAISGVAAMTNSSYEEIGYIFSQIAGVGKLMGQDAMQLRSRGLDIYTPLQEKLGKTREEVMELQSQGEISFALFAEAMNDAFGEQATKANETFEGALSNMKSALSRIGEVWYGPFYKAAIKPLNALRERFNTIKKMLDDGDDATRDLKDRLTDVMNIVSNIFSYLIGHADLRVIRKMVDGTNVILDNLVQVGHAWEKLLGIFNTDDAVNENDKLKESIKSLSETELQAAKDIWEMGKYGNGETRKNLLAQAGFDEESINRIQTAVDNFINSGYEWETLQKELNSATEQTVNSENEQAKSVRKIAATISYLSDILANAKQIAVNVGTAVVNVITTIAQAFLESFPFDSMTGAVDKFSKKILDISYVLVEATKNNPIIKKFAKEVFSIINDIWRVAVSAGRVVSVIVKSFFEVFRGNIKTIGDVSFGVSSITDKIADFSEKIADAAEKGEFFKKVFEAIKSTIEKGIDFIKDLPNKVKRVVDDIVKHLDKLKNKIKDKTGIDIQPYLDNIVTKVTEFVNDIKDLLSMDDTGKFGIVRKFREIKDSILSIFDNPQELSDSATNWFTESFNRLKENISQFNIEKVSQQFIKLKDSAIRFATAFLNTKEFNLMGFLKHIKLFASIALIAMNIILAMRIDEFVKKIEKPTMQLKGLVNNIFNTISSIGKTFGILGQNIDRIGKAAVWDIRANIFAKIAVSIAIIAGSLIAVALLPADKLVLGVMTIATLSMALAVMTVAVSKLQPIKENEKANTALLQASVVIGTMVATIKILEHMSYDDIAKGVLTIMMLTSIITVMSGLLAVASRIAKTKEKNHVEKNNTDISKMMLGLSVMTFAMATALTRMAKVIDKLDDPKSMTKAVIALCASMGSTILAAVAFTAVAKYIDPDEFKKTAKAVSAMFGGLMLIVPTVYALSYAIDKFGWSTWESFGMMFAGLSIVVAEMGLLSKYTEAADLMASAASIAIAIGSLNLMLPPFLIMAGIIAGISNGEKVIAEARNMLLGTFVVAGVILGGLSKLTNAADLIATAGSLSLLFLSLVPLIPVITALAMVGGNDALKAAAAVSLITITIGAITVLLGAVDAATGHSISIVLLALAGSILTFGISFARTVQAIASVLGSIAKVITAVKSTHEVFEKTDTKKIDQAAENLKYAIKKYINVISGLTPLFSEAVLDFLKTISVTLSEAYPTIMSIMHTIQLMIFSIAIKVATTALTAFEAFMRTMLEKDESGTSLASRLAYYVTTFGVDVMVGVFSALRNKLKQVLSKEADKESSDGDNESIWKKMLRKICIGILEALEVFDEYIEPFANKIWVSFIKLVKGISSAINEHQDELDDALIEFIKALGNSIANFRDAFTNLLVQTFVWEPLGAIVKNIIEAWKNIKTFITNSWHKVKKLAGDTANQVKEGFIDKKNTIVDKIKGFFDDIFSAIKEKLEAIKNWIDEEVKKITDLVSNAFEADKKAKKAVVKYGGGILGAFMSKDALDTHSPSKAFKKVAEWCVEGFNNGISSNEGGTTSLIKDFANNILGTFGDGLTLDSLKEKLTGFFGGSFNTEDLMNSLGVDLGEQSIDLVWDTSALSDLNLSDYTGSGFDVGTSMNLAGNTDYSIGSGYNYASTSGAYSGGSNAELANAVNNISEKISRLEVRMDTDALVGALYAGIDEKLGERQILAGRGVYA